MRRRRPRKDERPSALTVDPYVRNLLQKITDGKTLLHFRKNQKIFSEGEKADAIYFIQSGKVKITVVSTTGKEAAMVLLGRRDFFGEGCLAGQSLRTDSAVALEPLTAFRVDKRAMLQALRRDPEFSEKFVAALLMRNIRLQEDLRDQFFNHSEKRLARVLVKLAGLSQHVAAADIKLGRLNHETLAEMVGTTRSRISYFMNKFRKSGLIDYDGELTIRPDLLTDVVLHD